MQKTHQFRQRLVLTLVLTSLLSSGLSLVSHNAIAAPQQQSIELSQSIQTRLPKPITTAVLRDVAQRSGLAISLRNITQGTPKTFGNPCEFNFGEICTKEYRPIRGWIVVVRVRNQPWTYHVNQTGSQIVLDPKINPQGSNQLPQAIANDILNDASRRSGISSQQLQITKVTRKTFSNPCRFNFGEICTEEYRPIPSWEVVVRVQNQSWTYHVNQSGLQIVLDPKADY